MTKTTYQLDQRLVNKVKLALRMRKPLSSVPEYNRLPPKVKHQVMRQVRRGKEAKAAFLTPQGP